MPADTQPFSAFGRRLTRAYALLAVALIVLVGAATSAVAFIGYVSTLNDGIVSTTQAVKRDVATFEKRHEPIGQYAQALVESQTRPRIRVTVYDTRHNLLAGGSAHSSRVTSVVVALLGLHHTEIDVPGGEIHIGPDIDGFARYQVQYWLTILPIGILAMLLAWFIVRRITGSAIQPLVDVTQALRKIAGGDFSPELVLERNNELRDLTTAYNDVAYRLSAATAERRRNDAEMRQFIADAGHELRTPLTVIMGYLDVLQQGVVRDAEGVSHIYETMLGEGRRMKTVIEKLIFLARLERESSASGPAVDLSAIAGRAVDALKPLAGDRIHFASSGKTTAVADDGELYEAVKNVIENAVRYAPGSPIDVRVTSDDGHASIVVTDRGPGMSAVDIEHAFDRFYRGSTRELAEGSGLGLAIAKRAVERVGGSISLDSALREGTTVTMTFPSP